MEPNKNDIEEIKSKRSYQLDENPNNNYFKSFQEQNQLSLRKKKINEHLLSKRKTVTETNYNQTKMNLFEINLNEVCTNDEIKANPIAYIKSKFDIKIYFKYLFSNNLNQIKEALYLIKTFISLQIKELELNQRILSRNDTDLINCLCDYLLHSDRQIVYTACFCIGNLTFFPRNVEKRIYTERNLEIIMKFFRKYDLSFGYEMVALIANINTNNDVRKYFILHGGIDRIIELTNSEINDNKIIMNIIRLIYNVLKIFYADENDDKNFLADNKNIIDVDKQKIFMPLLPFIKKVLYTNFVENSWREDQKSIKHFNKILKFYTLLEETSSFEITKKIISDDFSKTLIEYYFKIPDDNSRNELMIIFINLLSKDDSINQEFIDNEIINLFNLEISRIEYNNYSLLNNIIYACSNIASGPADHIEVMMLQGLIWKLMDIVLYYKDYSMESRQIKYILYNTILTLANVISSNCSKNVKGEILIYQNFLIVDIFGLEIRNNLIINNDQVHLFELCCFAILELIMAAESELEKTAENEFKNKLMSNKIEEVFKDKLVNENIGKELESSMGMIIDYINQE